jgi:hypothetical protein
MRALAAIAAALVLAPAAGAARPPLPITYNGLHVIKLQSVPKAKHLASCSVHSKTNTKLGKASRKVLPVACEQPPRVKLTGISGAISALIGK